MRPAPLAYIAACVAITAVAGFFALQPGRSGTAEMWALLSVPTVALAAVAAIWARREELLAEWLLPRWGDFSFGLLGALALFGAGWASVLVFAPVGSPREIWLVSLYGQLGSPRDLQAHTPAVAATIAVVSASEEIVWRGMVRQLLANALGSRTAWVWAAGLYALCYVPTLWALGTPSSGPNPSLVGAALGGGLLWGWFAQRFGRLGPGIVAHAFFDWAVVMMFPLWAHYR